MMLGRNKNVKKLIKLIPKNTEGIEIGGWKGETSKMFLPKARLLHLVDPWSKVYKGINENGDFKDYLNKYSNLVGSNNKDSFDNYYEKIYQDVKEQFSQQPVKIYRESSDSFFSHFSRKVDWIYIDGSHHFQNVYKDLKNSYYIIKEKGLLLGDDYSEDKPGVMEAVQTFAVEYSLEFKVVGKNQFLFQL